MKKILPIAAVVVVIAVIVGVALGHKKNNSGTSTTTSSTSSSSSMNSTSSSSSSSTAPTATDKVSITNFSFSPASITVKKGSAVTWTNNDSVTHTVTADSGTGPNSGDLAPGKTYSFTYNSTGTFAYHCSIHTDMHGSVTVTQ